MGSKLLTCCSARNNSDADQSNLNECIENKNEPRIVQSHSSIVTTYSTTKQSEAIYTCSAIRRNVKSCLRIYIKIPKTYLNEEEQEVDRATLYNFNKGLIVFPQTTKKFNNEKENEDMPDPKRMNKNINRHFRMNSLTYKHYKEKAD